ncbi:diguanylate cyclase domain-containing protein [Pseudothermotoga sp. U03pept]|uniref:diguanylate cyclase n=1 Tax=Pseudothermotoga sp. U03pept TaxID=3447012 RepID=UPI003F02E076
MIHNKHSVRSFVYILLIGLSIAVLGIFVLTTIFPRIENLIKNSLIRQATDMLDIAYTLISQHYESYNKGFFDESTAQRMTKEHLGTFLYGLEKLDYFWVLNKEGILLVHPYLKDYVNHHYLEIEDSLYKDAIEKILQAAKENKPYVEYDFYRYDRERTERKISAIKVFEPWGWIVGTGFYRTTLMNQVKSIENSFKIAVYLFLTLLAVIYFNFLAQYKKANREISRILKEISTERDRLKTLIETMPQPVALFDQTKKLLEYNRAFSEIQNYDHEPSTCRTCADNSQQSFEITLKTPSGTKWYRVNCIPIFDKDKNHEGFIKILSDITEQKLQILFWQDKANQDPLTGVANRNVLEQLMDSFPDLGQEFSVIMLDIDGFKQVNDTYGHLVGDQVLIHFAETIKNSLRKDTFFVRFGGDEFLIIAPRSGKETAKNLVDRLRKEFKTPLQTNGGQVSISFCAGIASFPEDGKKLRNLIEQADKALYKAKSIGTNQTGF